VEEVEEKTREGDAASGLERFVFDARGEHLSCLRRLRAKRRRMAKVFAAYPVRMRERSYIVRLPCLPPCLLLECYVSEQYLA
jgi:hypothetical protein